VRNPHLPPWERVLDEAAAAGFGGLELGLCGALKHGAIGGVGDANKLPSDAQVIGAIQRVFN